MKALVDKGTCTGCGLCSDSVPEVFEMGDDVAKVKVSPGPAAKEAAVKEAVTDCPAEAILVE